MSLRSKKGFPKVIKDSSGRVWHKVRNEKHRDMLEATNEYEFEHCYEDMIGGFSFHLYYSDWVFKPSRKDLQTIAELDEMLEFFMTQNVIL